MFTSFAILRPPKNGGQSRFTSKRTFSKYLSSCAALRRFSSWNSITTMPLAALSLTAEYNFVSRKVLEPSSLIINITAERSVLKEICTWHLLPERTEGSRCWIHKPNINAHTVLIIVFPLILPHVPPLVNSDLGLFKTNLNLSVRLAIN